MTDYTKLVKALRYCVSGVCKNCSYFEKCKKNGTAMAELHNDAADAIEALQAQLPKRGEWEPVPDPEGRPYKYVCSNCHRFHVNEDEWYDYCPNCGAKMEVQE